MRSLYKDKLGKSVDIKKGVRFTAKDRSGRVVEYIDTGRFSGYEKILIDLSDGSETWVVENWFLERIINVKGGKS